MTTTATPLKQYLMNEASSGTTPTAYLDSAASPANIPITYAGSYAWTTDNTGRAIAWGSGAGGGLNTSVGTTINALSGSKTASLEFAIQFSAVAAAGTGPIGAFTSDGIDIVGVDFRDITTGGSGTAGPQVYYNTAADGDQEESGAAFTVSGGYYVMQVVVDTAAANRKTYYNNGFRAATSNSLITANTTLSFGTGTVEIQLAKGPSTNWTGATQSYGAIYASALTAANALNNAVRLMGDSDHDPNSSIGAYLFGASTNGGTDDASTASSDHTAQPTVTIASGSNRMVVAAVSYSGVSTGLTTKTLGGVAFQTAIDSGPDGSGRGCALLYILDANLPATGSQTATLTVDGASGTLCATLYYLENVKQSAPGNTVNTSGTGTSITGTPASSDGAGSIRFDCLLDATTTDTPVPGTCQVKLAGGGTPGTGKLNGTSTGNTHTMCSSARYTGASASNPTSWSGLTNTSAKILVSAEFQVFAAAAAPLTSGGPTWWRSTSPFVEYYARPRYYPSATPAAAPVAPPAIGGVKTHPSLYRPPPTVPVYVSTQINPSWATSYAGTVSAATSSFGAAAAGLITFVAIGSAQISPFASAGTAVESLSCSGSAASSPFSVMCAALETLNAAAVTSASSFAAAGSGTETFSGTCAATCSTFAASGAAAELFTGLGNSAPSSFVTSGTGRIGDISGTGNSAAAPLTSSGSALESFVGSGTYACSSFAAAGASLEGFSANGTATCSSLAATGAAAVGTVFVGVSASTISSFGSSGTATEGYVATSTAACSSFGVAVSAAELFTGSGSAACQPVAAIGSAAIGTVFSGPGVASLQPFTSTSSALEALTASVVTSCQSFAPAGTGLDSFLAAGLVATQAFAASGISQEAISGSGTTTCSSFVSTGGGIIGGAIGAGVCSLSSLVCSAAAFELLTATAGSSTSGFAVTVAGLESFFLSAVATCQPFGAIGSATQGTIFAGTGTAAIKPHQTAGAVLEDFVGTALATCSQFVPLGTSLEQLVTIGSPACSIQPFASVGAAVFAAPVASIGSAALAPFACTGSGKLPAVVNSAVPLPLGQTIRVRAYSHRPLRVIKLKG